MTVKALILKEEGGYEYTDWVPGDVLSVWCYVGGSDYVSMVSFNTIGMTASESIKYKGPRFRVFYDKYALLNNRKCTMIIDNTTIKIHGTCLIVKIDEDDKEMSIEPSDIDILKTQVHFLHENEGAKLEQVAMG